MSLWRWTKMLVGGGVIIVGGPMLVDYVRPTDEELRSQYNPDLKARSLAEREEREQEFDDFVTRLQAASRSDKQIWTALEEMKKEDKKRATKRQQAEEAEAQAQRDEMRRQAGLRPLDGQKKS